MKKRYTLLVAFPLFILLMAGKPEKNHNGNGDLIFLQSVERDYLILKTSNGTWQIVNSKDSTIANEIKVKIGDKVKWTPDGTDASFKFSNDKIFGKLKYNSADGVSLALTVLKSAPDTSFYNVFCAADSQYVDPNSPPKIIISR